MMQQQPMPQEGEVPPEAAGGMEPPPMTGGMAPGPVPNQVFEATGGVPPELLSQLQNQMGMELPNL